MNLESLKWIKSITPEKGWHHHWAYSFEELTDTSLDIQPFDRIVDCNGITIVPLWFKGNVGADKPQQGDLILLSQHSKITHLVQVLDTEPLTREGQGFRYVQFLWWLPHADWKRQLPHRSDILGFDPRPQGTTTKNF